MEERRFYEKVLGLTKPWRVREVNLDVSAQKVDIDLSHAEGVVWSCPTCHRSDLKGYDHSEKRVWRHLDTCQFGTYLHARIPRVQCPEHGVVQVDVPWASKHSRFTLLMERFAVSVLAHTDTVKGACEILRMSWDETWRILERAVERGLARKKEDTPPYLGVDEKAFKKGHRYVTVVNNLTKGCVEYVGEDRNSVTLQTYWKGLSQEQRSDIKAIAMDMWEPYVHATRFCVPKADEKIVFDKFHIMRQLGKAVDHVRRQEHQTLLKKGDDRLKGTKYLWLYNTKNFPEKHQPRFDELKHQQLKVGKAWAIKESFQQLWHYHKKEWAKRFFQQWFFWATHSRLKPIVQVAYLFKRHLTNILTYCQHHITNAVSEGLNSRIMAIKRRACGFKNLHHFKIAILFHCGGLQLYP